MPFADQQKQNQEQQDARRTMMGLRRVVSGMDDMHAARQDYKDMPSSPQELRASISQMSEEMIANAGPELQSLWQFRDHPDLFEAQLSELEQNGSMDMLHQDYVQVMADMQAAASIEMAAAPIAPTPAPIQQLEAPAPQMI